MQVFTDKQREYRDNANHRWNLAVGAVRSGKSYIAIRYIIPKNIRDRIGRKGIALILGVTKESIERNVLLPMRELWGEAFVSRINSRNIARIFGENVYCIGAENKGQVSKIRGSEIKFCYCDELADIHPEVFDILKSRLSLSYSCFHGACNPASPHHFVKRFIDSAPDAGIDLYCQHYTIYDNPFLPPEYIRALEAEYAGTVYFKRYIEGLWAQAEGLVYPMFEQAIEDPWEPITWDGDGNAIYHARDWCVSVDYGTMNAFAALLWARDSKGVWHCVDEYRYSGRDEGHLRTDEDYVVDVATLCADVPDDTQVIVDPSAASFITALRRCTIKPFRVVPADNSVLDGIRDTAVCLQTGKVRISSKLHGTIREFEGYVWDDSAHDDRPIKLEDHCMDALRYFVRTKRVCKPDIQYQSPFGM